MTSQHARFLLGSPAASRWNRHATTATTLAAASAVLASLAVFTAAEPAQAATSGPGQVTGQTRPAPAQPLRNHTVSRPSGPKIVTMKQVVWPAAGGSAVMLARGGRAVVPGTPVTVADEARPAVAGAGATTRGVRVDVAPRDAARVAGVDGLLLTMATTAGSPQPTTVSVDVRGVAGAYGGDWAARARLVELTGCTVAGTGAGQEVSGCTGRRTLPTRTDGTGILTATVTPAAVTSAAGGSAAGAAVTTQAGKAGAAAAAGTTVLAAAATGSGTTGSYAATPLSAASSWQAGGPSGTFNWSYPFTVPPVPGGLEPPLSISYDSGSVDGRVATSNNQPSWVGDGFDLSSGFIERRYVSCADDMTGGNNTVKTGDLCWKSDNATVSLGTRSGPLVKDATSKAWRLFSDDGSKITHYGTPGVAGEYWTLTGTDGTVYTFGKGTGAVTGAATNSAWSVPVFGNQSGEPGYVAGNYAGSVKSLVWRWNLDSIVDVHGNAVNYFYTPETNKYGQNLNKTVVSYTRSGYLTRIDYGLRTDATTKPAAAQVVFTTAERCLPSGSITCVPSQLTASNASSWPDVPFDQICTAATGSVANPATGGCASVLSPAFFSRIRLTGLTTKVATGNTTTPYRDVDRYTITHTFPDPGDGTSKVLWPSSVAHTGVTASGATLAAPKVTLYPTTQMPNRVDKIGDNAPPINRFRLSWVDNGVGGTVSVGYSATDCTPSSKPADPANNTRRCFPVYYTPPGATAPVLNWFHKYLVTRVDSADAVGGQVDTVASYQYVGSPAWHFDRDDLTPPSQRTWGQWRGYNTVRTFTGGPAGPWTASEALYLLGMDGDCTNTACTTKRSVTVTDSRKGTITDVDQANGFTRETRSFNGATLTFDAGSAVTSATLGTIVGETLNTPWFSAAHANDGVRQAKIRETAVVNARTYTASGALAREAQNTTTYDDNGMPVTYEDAGDTSTTADDLCTTTTYAADTTHWILEAPTSTRTVAKPCNVTPVIPTDVVSATRTLYDGATSWSTTPTLTKADPTTTQVASGGDAATRTLTYTTSATNTFDAVGRIVDTADALSRHTKTTYTPPGVGPVTSVAVTNPANQTVTTTLEPGRGVVLTTTDANARTTTNGYDALGRLTAVWLPNRATSASASRTFAYAYANATAKTPTKVTSGVLRNDGTYTSTHAYYDGLLRAFQSQAPAADGTANRIVSTTEFDGRGLVVRTTGPAWATGAAGSGAATVADANTPMLTTTTYDGAGRVVRTDQRAGIGSANWHTYTTTTTFDGTKTTVTPPAGGIPTTTIVDARGNTTTLRQYATASGTAGAWQDTTYAYRPDGLLKAMTDPAGNTWSRNYDLRGRLVSSTDPDAGTTTTTYDHAGQVTTVTDARNGTLAYKYDSLGRKLEERSGSATGTLLAAWTYDTATGGKGRPATSTRYYNANAYTRAVTGYDNLYNVTGTSLTIPAAETGIAGTYTTASTYNLDGQLYQYREPIVTGLPNEGMTYNYTSLGQPYSVGAGTSLLVAATTYSAYGEALTVNEGPSPTHGIYLTYGYQDGTRRLATRKVARQGLTGTTAMTSYTYDDAGNLTSIADKPTDPGTTAETQCFTYTPLRQLSTAWTPADGNCATTPATSLLGGPAPYWSDWTYDTATGNRKTQTDHTTSGNTTATYTYPAAKAARPHAVTSIAKTGAVTSSETFTYDAAGSTRTRTPNSATATTYDWDQAGRISTATTPKGNTSYLYDADGNRLIAKDPTGTTVYIDGITELRYNTTTKTTTATRTYSWLGQTLAIRSDGTGELNFTLTDPHNTGELSIKSSNGTITTRRTNPFGQPRGTAPTAWAGDRGFVGGIQDTTTGLTQLGARPYDPTLGRFLTVDPILDLADPNQWNPYNYSANNPTTWSDPTGLEHDAEGGVGGAGCTRHCPAAPGADYNSGYPTKPKKKSNGLTGGLKKGAKGVGGFLGGVGKGAKALLWDDNPQVNAIHNIYDLATNPSETIERQRAAGEAFWQDPLGSVWNAVTADVREDWNKGDKASAIGRATFDIATLFLGGESAVTKLGKLGKASKVEKAAETASLGEGSVVSDLLYGARPGEGLPGATGAAISRRPTVQELENLSAKHDVEFAVTYKYGPGPKGGGGQYFLHSGGPSSVPVPLESDRMLIYHTHPGGTPWASAADRNVLDYLGQIGSPQRVSSVIPVGRGVAIPFGGNG